MIDPPAVRRILVGFGGALLLSGCADRALTPRPQPPPGASTWLAVWLAALAATAVAAALVLVAARGQLRTTTATVVLALQAGVAWVLLVVGGGVLLRGLQLVDDPIEQRPATLARLPGPDGDARLYVLLLVALVILVGLPAVLLTLGARFTLSGATADQWLAFTMLAVEVGLGCVAAGALLFDVSRTWPVLALAVNAVPSSAGILAAWPPARSDRRRDRPAPAAIARSATTVPRTYGAP